MIIQGGCFCGAIRYALRTPLYKARSCHCSECRKLFSGAASAYAQADAQAFSWTQGEQDLSHYTSQQGWGVGFCRHCGSTLCGFYQGQLHGITLGSVDDDPGIRISQHLFVESKAPWDEIGDNAPQFATWPPKDNNGQNTN